MINLRSSISAARVPIVGLLSLFATTAAFAAPQVNSVSGVLSDRATLTVSGSGFRDKVPAAPLIWADFENGDDPTSLGRLSSWNSINRLGSTSEGYRGTRGLKASDDSGNWTLRVDYDSWTDDHQKAYIFRRTKMNFLVTDDSQNWKSWRMWPEGENYPNVYMASHNGRIYVENIGQESGFWGGHRIETTDWVAEELVYKASSLNNKDGYLEIRQDGRARTSGSLMTRSSDAPARMTANYVVHGVLANKSRWSPSWSSNNRMWVDDVYVDTTWARVLIGDAPRFSSVSRFDLQIPSAWSANSITVTANTDSFSSGSTVYLYVVDKDGDVNENGFPITVGSGAPPTNQAPTVDAGSDLSIDFGANASLNGTATDDGLPTPGALAVQWTKVAGPGDVTFTNGTSAAAAVAFSEPGVYRLRLTADDGGLTAADEISVTVAAAAINQPPSVSAGPDKLIDLNQTASLSGAASDDGLPDSLGALTVQWSKLSGPGNVTFTNATAAATEADVDAPGVYQLRLTASDGESAQSDDVTITVNAPPVSEAGADRVLAVGQSISLDGTLTDDGRPDPPGSVTASWSQTSGPGVATFGDAAAVDTSVGFSLPGVYTIRLTGSDGRMSAYDEVTAEVNGSPSVSVGGDFSVDVGLDALLDATVSDDGLPSDPGALTTAWSQVSGPGSAVFGSPSSIDTHVSFTAPGTYLLRLAASDGLSSVADEVTVTVRSGNQTPIVQAGIDFTVAVDRPGYLDGVVTDDGQPNPPGAVTTLWTQLSGPSPASFAQPAAVDTEVGFDAAGTYVFRLHANDGASTAFDEVTVTVSGPENDGPVVSAGGDDSATVGRSFYLSGSVTDDGRPNPPGTVSHSWAQVGGPGTASIEEPFNARTRVVCDATGVYSFRLVATDGSLVSSDEVLIKVNEVPVVERFAVDAGESLTVYLNQEAKLVGRVVRDAALGGSDADTYTYKWEKRSGPAGERIESPSSPESKITFASPGAYRFRLTVKASDWKATDEVDFIVAPAPQLEVKTMRNIVRPQRNEAVEFAVDLVNPAGVVMEIYDRLGGIVNVIRGVWPPGEAVLSWDGRNDTGSLVASGVYVVSISVDGKRMPMSRVIVLK